jgi:hypothetical protein
MADVQNSEVDEKLAPVNVGPLHFYADKFEKDGHPSMRSFLCNQNTIMADG